MSTVVNFSVDFTLQESVAAAADVRSGEEVEKPVKGRCGDNLVAETGTPFGETIVEVKMTSLLARAPETSWKKPAPPRSRRGHTPLGHQRPWRLVDARRRFRQSA